MTFRDGTGNVETIHTTDDHPFYLEGTGWTEADELAVGARLSEADGTDVVLMSSVREEHATGITVFNFEVEGDHTYFVEDGIGEQSALWVHNSCLNGKFVGMLGGKAIEFPSVSVRSRTFTVRSAADTDALQAAATIPKSNFVKALANDSTSIRKLQQAGISDAQIARMRDGFSPDGFQVHHKDPLKFGGDNSQSNFILLQSSSPGKVNYHSALTNYQNSLNRNVPDGESIETTWPEFSDVIYPL